MDAHTDIPLTRSDTSPIIPVEGVIIDHGSEAGTTAPREDSILDSLSLPSPDVRFSLAIDNGGIETHEEQSPSNQEPSDLQTERSTIDRKHCVHPQSNSDHVILPGVTEEVPPLECATDGPTLSMNINDAEASAIVHPQESPLLRARTVSAELPPPDGREVNTGHLLNSIQIQHAEEQIQSAGLACMTDEEKTREDYHYEGLLRSLPPSSSPPQLFSSSPYVSSQSSTGDAEPSKMVLAVGVEQCVSSREYTQGDHVVPVAGDDSHLASEDFHSHDIAEIATSSETGKYCSQTGLTPCIEGGLGSSRKRSADHESHDPPPIKCPKPDPCLYPAPAPKRATLASQNHQFKKLAAPFRPPSKLLVATGGLAKATNNKEIESTTLQRSHDKTDENKSTISLQHKTLNTPRRVTQFKSPLVNRVLPADSRTIRLTPALQALERKLQLLKRAIKIKEENDEAVVNRLAGKWIEAGREVAYDVWDAAKDAGDLAGKVTFIHRSHGWENINDRSTPWGWDTKPGDPGEASYDPDTSGASCATGRQIPEEDDVGCNTLGTMLRQLGIDPEIFGWNDDKEVFSD